MPNEQNSAGAAAPAATEADGELRAMSTIVAVLKPLRDDERKRVLEYVLLRFGAVPMQASISSVTSLSSVAPSAPSSIPLVPGGALQDIRSLKQAKNPKSANEMAALVAYYVSESATGSERKAEIDKKDIERYFKSGGFKLTSKAGQTLVNARHAGYLDPGSDAGHYKLNPVGYNLVVHRLGTDGSSGKKRRRNRSEKKSPRRGKR
jgi:hypothetical protein